MSNAWRDVRRILCVRLDNLGDVLMTTPAIRALKTMATSHGRAPHVTLLASAAGSAVARHVPEIDATLGYDAPWVAAGRDQRLDLDIAARIAAHRFDAAVIFTCYSQSALPAAMLCGQAAIPLRLAHCRENPYGLLSDWVRDPEPEGGIRHEVARQLALVASIGAVTSDPRLSLRVEATARERFVRAAATRGIVVDGSYLVLHPGATAASRRWPADRFGVAAATLADRFGLPVLVTGSTGERELVRTVMAAARHDDVHDLSGALALDELVAAIDGAALLVSNNSGPVHIAAARGTPIVDLYARTNPQHTPWQVAHRLLSKAVPCANCQRSVCPEGHHACMDGIAVDDVVRAAEALLDPVDGGTRAPAFGVAPARSTALHLVGGKAVGGGTTRC